VFSRWKPALTAGQLFRRICPPETEHPYSRTLREVQAW